MIFRTLQRRLVLNTSVNLIKTTAGISAQMLSRTKLHRLLNKIDSGSLSKDGKIEAVHGLLAANFYTCWRRYE